MRLTAPSDNRPVLSLFALFAREEFRHGGGASALMGGLSIELNCWQMRNKPQVLLVLLINNRPFEPGASHAAAIVCSEGRGQWGWSSEPAVGRRDSPSQR